MTPRSTPQDAAVATSVVWSHPDRGLWVATGPTRAGPVHFGFIEEVDGGLGGFAAYDTSGQPLTPPRVRRAADAALQPAGAVGHHKAYDPPACGTPAAARIAARTIPAPQQLRPAGNQPR